MKYLIITFTSRNNLMSFAKILGSHHIPTRIINTPHKISSSCTLSIKTEQIFQSNIINLLRQVNLSGFLGLYSVNELNGYTQVVKII